jgi:hypothetical protein
VADSQPRSASRFSGVVREVLAATLHERISTVRKLGAVVMVGLALAVGACTSSTAPWPTPVHLTATAMVPGITPRDAAYFPGSEAAQPSINKHGNETIALVPAARLRHALSPQRAWRSRAAR